MQNTTDILAIDSEAIQGIVAVIFMLIAALGGLLRKKAKSGEGDGKTIILPPLDADESARTGPRPAPPSARPAQAPRPQRTAAPPGARRTPIAAQGRQPLARPTPVARQRPPQARPTPIRQPAQPQRRLGEPERRTGEPARPGPVPQRSDRIARPAPAQQPRPVRRPAVQSERQTHRVRAAEHAEAVADHAEHVASRLKEQQMRKFGELGVGEHFHGDQSVPTRSRHPLLARLNPQSMREAILLSEIIQPPLALRNEQSSGWF